MTARPLSPDAPGEEPAARRDAGAATSPLPWRLDESTGAIYDAHDRWVCAVGNPWDDPSPTDLRNGRAIVAAMHTLGGRHV